VNNSVVINTSACGIGLLFDQGIRQFAVAACLQQDFHPRVLGFEGIQHRLDQRFRTP
jgi:hypothetical protein